MIIARKCQGFSISYPKYTDCLENGASCYYQCLLSIQWVKGRLDIFLKLFLQVEVRKRIFCIRPEVIETYEVMHSFASLQHKQ